MFKIRPNNGFLKAISYNFYFHKNDVTEPLSALPININLVHYNVLDGTNGIYSWIYVYPLDKSLALITLFLGKKCN